MRSWIYQLTAKHRETTRLDGYMDISRNNRARVARGRGGFVQRENNNRPLVASLLLGLEGANHPKRQSQSQGRENQSEERERRNLVFFFFFKNDSSRAEAQKRQDNDLRYDIIERLVNPTLPGDRTALFWIHGGVLSLIYTSICEISKSKRN